MAVYTCPMHPDLEQDKPGRCPECGMPLVKSRELKVKSEIDKHAGHHTQDFLKKFWVSLVLTAGIIIFSSNLIRLALGSVIFFYGGWVFLASAVRELRGRLPGMMTLIAIAISAAYLYSFFSILFGTGRDLLFELSSLVAIMLLGHWLEMRSVQGVQGALKELAKLLPDKVEVVRNNKTEIIPLDRVREGDLMLVKPGGKIAADGEIENGDSEVDEALVTGESKPVNKRPGDKVIAGTINGDGSLNIRVTEIGERTFLAGVMRLVAEAQSSKSRLQMLSDRAAFYLTIIAITVGAATFVAWILAHAGLATATERLVAVLVITCPHALGLAVPLVASISTTMAARRGFLVKQRLALEAARNIDVVLFDKTGTLTKGEFGVEEIMPNQESRISNLELLKYAASVNQHSEHPIAKAIVAEAKKRNLELFEAKNFQRIPGKGARAEIDGQEVIVGSEAILHLDPPPREEGLGEVNPLLISLASSSRERSGPSRRGETQMGRTIIYVVKNQELLGSIALADQIREESREAVKTLKNLGIKTGMITGDAEDVAVWVAKELKIDEYFARVLPEQKAEKVKLLQSRGLKVAMIGDGVNDAPALGAADLGIAIGAGTNVAIESAGIILVNNDPRDIARIIRLSQATYRKMIQNLFWATGYNAVALPLAAGVLAGRGIILQPALAAVFMSVSTIIVAFNAVLLRKQKI